MEKVSTRIKKAMEFRGTTAAQLCKKASIPRPTMSQYLSDKYLPKADPLGRIAKALNVNEAWLMGYDDVPITGNPVTVEDLSETELTVISLLRSLPADKQKLLVQLLEASLGGQ